MSPSRNRSLVLAIAGASAASMVVASSASAGVPPNCAAFDQNATTLTATVSAQGAQTQPSILACGLPSGMANFWVYDGRTGNQAPADSSQLTGLGITNATPLSVDVTIPGATAVASVILGTGNSASFNAGTQKVTIVGSPRSLSFTSESCPVLTCTAQVAEVTWSSAFQGGFIVAKPGSPMSAMANQMNGAWVATTAMQWSLGIGGVNESGATCGLGAPGCAPAFKIDLAGPHFQFGGSVLNEAYFKAFLPTALMAQALQVSDPQAAAALELFRKEGSSTEPVPGMTCSDVTGGKVCEYGGPGSHFSAPTFSIRKARAATGGGASGGGAGGGTASGASSSSAGTAVMRIGAVTAAKAKAKGRAVRVTWKAPSGAATTQRYKVVLTLKKKSVSKTVTGTSVSFSGLGKGSWKGTVTPVSSAGAVEGPATGVSVRVK